MVDTPRISSSKNPLELPELQPIKPQTGLSVTQRSTPQLNILEKFKKSCFDLSSTGSVSVRGEIKRDSILSKICDIIKLAFGKLFGRADVVSGVQVQKIGRNVNHFFQAIQKGKPEEAAKYLDHAVIQISTKIPNATKEQQRAVLSEIFRNFGQSDLFSEPEREAFINHFEQLCKKEAGFSKAKMYYDCLAAFVEGASSLPDSEPINTAVADLAKKLFRGGESFPHSFFSDPSTIYKNSGDLLKYHASLTTFIEKNYSGETKTALLAKLQHANDMAVYCTQLEKSHWKPTFAAGVVSMRLKMREAGVTSGLPKQLLASSDPQLRGQLFDPQDVAEGGQVRRFFDNMRGRDPTSLTRKFETFLVDNGLPPALLGAGGILQNASSWSPTSQAFKYFLSESRDVPSDNYFWMEGQPKAKENYERLARHVSDETFGRIYSDPQEAVGHILDACQQNEDGGEIDERNLVMLSEVYYAQCAITQEILENVDLPFNDRGERALLLTRTEDVAVMRNAGLIVGEQHAKLKSGVCESSSLGESVTTVAGTEITRQEVPYQNIFSTYFLGLLGTDSEAYASTSCLGTDSMLEVLFMREGLTFSYDQK